MTDPDFQTIENTGSEHNISELSVGDVARAIKRTLETEFGRLRIRGVKYPGPITMALAISILHLKTKKRL